VEETITILEELIYELDDVAYSKFSSRTDDIEKQIKKTKQEKREPQVIFYFIISVLPA
jgi:metal-responsive CopG/Arc/MetJ family transcriptional regulator